MGSILYIIISLLVNDWCTCHSQHQPPSLMSLKRRRNQIGNGDITLSKTHFSSSSLTFHCRCMPCHLFHTFNISLVRQQRHKHHPPLQHILLSVLQRLAKPARGFPVRDLKNSFCSTMIVIPLCSKSSILTRSLCN